MNWIGLWTLTSREVGRFFSVYRQTILPGLISSALYILIFGFTLQQRIAEINGVPYTLFILPGLIMMNTLTNASSNTASSMLQMKLLQQLPDILTAPLSSLEISLAYIINWSAGQQSDFFSGIYLHSCLDIFQHGSFIRTTCRQLGSTCHDAKLFPHSA